MMYFWAFMAGAVVFGAGCIVGAALAGLDNLPSGGIVDKPEGKLNHDCEIITFNPKPKDK